MAKTAPRDEANPEEQVLPPIVNGELARIDSIEIQEKKTRPPKRYTEGALVRDMKDAGKFVTESSLRKVLRDSSGLGTSATRDAIIDALKDREFIRREGNNLVSTKKGRDLIAYLPPEFSDVALTARWEAELEVVAQQGGGPALESRLRDEVARLVTTLKAHGPMNRSESVSRNTSTTKENSMSENGEKRRSGPTDKMLEFAKSIAKRVGASLPDEAKDDFDVCRAFIEEHKDAAQALPAPPTKKQLDFAKSIADKKGLTIPASTLKNMKELSAWINANK
jgi:DNA topoisomerase-3